VREGRSPRSDQPGDEQDRPQGRETSVASHLLGLRLLPGCPSFVRRGLRLDSRHRAVGCYERRPGHALDVRRGDLVDAIDLAEQLAPIAVQALRARELLRQARVRVQRADQVGLGAVLTMAKSDSATGSVWRRSISLRIASSISAFVWPGTGIA